MGTNHLIIYNIQNINYMSGTVVSSLVARKPRKIRI